MGCGINTPCYLMKKSKFEIAIDLLADAKELFQNTRFASATVLAGAARRILADLCKAHKIESTIDQVSDSTGHRAKDIHNLIAATYNQMRHANHDPDELVEVSDAEPKCLLTCAITDLVLLSLRSEKWQFIELINFVRSFKEGP